MERSYGEISRGIRDIWKKFWKFLERVLAEMEEIGYDVDGCFHRMGIPGSSQSQGTRKNVEDFYAAIPSDYVQLRPDP